MILQFLVLRLRSFCMKKRLLKNNFFLIRHRESENNVLKIESSKLENKNQFGLSKTGKQKTAAEAKKYTHFDLIITSPFRRAKETASYFSHTSGCEIIEDDRIREVDAAAFELCSYNKAEFFIENNSKETSFPEGESLQQAQDRVIEFFEAINHQYNNKNILIVSHGYPLEVMLFHVYKDFDWEKYLKEYDRARKVFKIIL